MKKSDLEQKLIQSLVKEIGLVDMAKIIAADRLPNGKFMIKLNGQRATDAEIQMLKREAETIEQTSIYKMLVETLKYQAQQNMFEKSQKAEDVFITGKFFLHAISTFEHIIWAFKNPQLLAEEKIINKHINKKVDMRKLVDNN